MTCLINFGYRFSLPQTIVPDGSMILANSIPIHQLERRKKEKYPHLENLYFDPQLYLAGLDPIQSPRPCARLASYPWFGVTGLHEYDSNIQKQKGWMDNAVEKIASVWPNGPIDPNINPDKVNEVVEECIEFQLGLGTKVIILPSPLTHDTSSDYSNELLWLDAGLNYLRDRDDIAQPVFATIALTDVCIRYADPTSNPFIDMILDAVGAREIDGIYLVVEQATEANMARQISNTRVLWSALHIVHIIKYDLGLQVGVNFFGPFGLVLEAVGADFWATGWYKSMFRLRIADQIGTGRAYPSYWSYVAASDIHLDADFDKLRDAKKISPLLESTIASSALLLAIQRGESIRNVPAWEYRQSNITAAREHYLQSVIASEHIHTQYKGQDRVNYIENGWLVPAVEHCKGIQEVLGSAGKTKVEHVQAWLAALRSFRRAQNF